MRNYADMSYIHSGVVFIEFGVFAGVVCFARCGVVNILREILLCNSIVYLLVIVKAIILLFC